MSTALERTQICFTPRYGNFLGSFSQYMRIHTSPLPQEKRNASDPISTIQSSVAGYDSLIDPHLDPSLIDRVNNPQNHDLISPHFIEYYQDQKFMEDLEDLLAQETPFIVATNTQSRDQNAQKIEKRIERTFQKKMARLKNRKDSLDQFKKQRKVAYTTFLDKENTKWLFEPKKKVNWGTFEDGNDYLNSDMSSYTDAERLLSSGGLSYHDYEMQNTLLLLSKFFINAFLAEINIRNVFGDEDLGAKPKSDSFLAQDIFIRRFDETKSREILTLLTQLYSVEKAGVPNSLKEFLSQLDRQGVADIVKGASVSESFDSLAFYRLNFSHYKSSQHLNYDRSDLTRHTQSYQPVKFHSREIRNDEFVQKFERAFSEFDKSTDTLKHLNLILQIAKILATSRSYVPDYTAFKILIEKLGHCGLYNYQALVFESLPDGKYMQSLLGNDTEGAKLPKQSFHYQKIVEDCPGFISTLLQYAVRNKDVYTFRQILKFFRLKDIAGYESGLSKSGYSELISFSKYRKSAFALLTLKYDSNESLCVPVDSVYQAIKGCIQLNELGFIDPLVTLLILQSKEANGKLEVELNFDRNPQIGTDSIFYSLMPSAKQLSQKIFTKELLMLSLEAARKDNDFSRLTYLVPHLDSYVIRGLETSGGHLQSIKEHLYKKMVRKMTTQEEENTFMRLDSGHDIDLALIDAIFKTLFQFIDRRQVYSGLLPTFDELLDFKNTVSDLVREREAKNNDFSSTQGAEIGFDRLRPIKE